jgi:hypothetical protein
LLLAVLEYAALYVLGTNIAWALRTTGDGQLGKAVELARRWSDQLWLNDVLRLAYYLLGPYFILVGGYASLLEFGLADLDWVRGVGLTLAIGAGSLPLLLWVWWQYVRLTGDRVPMQEALWLEQPLGWTFALREAILLESWWALLRSPMLLLAGPYLGVYLGLALAAILGLLNPHARHALLAQGQREGGMLTASLAVLSATLYVFVHNLWLCIALHFVLRMAVLTLVHNGTTRRSPAHTP